MRSEAYAMPRAIGPVAAVAAQPKGEDGPAARASILLVDDRPENLLALESLLEPMGHDLHRATSGEEALRKVLQRDFAVILLDVQMPGMDGFETAEVIKTRARSRSTPIIFVTAINKDEEYVFRGYDVGAVDYLFKPLQPEILRGKVRAFIELFEKSEQVRRQEQMLREAEVRERELRHRAEILASQARTREIMETAQDAILTFDEGRAIDLFNSAAERMFGLSARSARGAPLESLFHPDTAEALERTVRRSAGLRSTAALPAAERLTAVAASGDTLPVEATVSCLRLQDGKVFTLIARDVSDRERYERKLREHAAALRASRDELERANAELVRRQNEIERAMQERSRFYASMSHELRTPINAIMGYQQLLTSGVYGDIDPKLEDPLRAIARSTEHLLDLINDVLDLSKMEAEKLDLQLSAVELPNLVEDLFVTVRPLADEFGSDLRLETGDAEGRVITTDERRVRQILLNLLSNAVKFGNGQPVLVRCACAEDGKVEVSVTDRGAGIPSDQLEPIFDEFVQLESPERRRGTGLGLPISRRLAERLGGRLEVESCLGQGSTFRLVIGPLDAGEA